MSPFAVLRARVFSLRDSHPVEQPPFFKRCYLSFSLREILWCCLLSFTAPWNFAFESGEDAPLIQRTTVLCSVSQARLSFTAVCTGLSLACLGRLILLLLNSRCRRLLSSSNFMSILPVPWPIGRFEFTNS